MIARGLNAQELRTFFQQIYLALIPEGDGSQPNPFLGGMEGGGKDPD
jgi:hypothetical protein